MFVSCDTFRNSSSTSPVLRILGKLRRTGGVRARLPCVLSYLLSGSAQARGLYQRVSSHFTLLPTPPALIGTAYPAPNPGRDKDKALYCRPIACGRRSSVYVCPPCNRSPATGRCVAGNLVTITPAMALLCRLPAGGKSDAGRGDWVFLEGLPHSRVGFVILRYLFAFNCACGISFSRSVDFCSTCLTHTRLTCLGPPSIRNR